MREPLDCGIKSWLRPVAILLALAACQTVVGEPTERVVPNEPRTAVYSYLDAWDMGKQWDDGPLWGQEYRRYITSGVRRNHTCYVVYQYKNVPIGMDVLTAYLERIAKRYVQASETKDAEVQTRVVANAGATVKRVTASFELPGRITRTRGGVAESSRDTTFGGSFVGTVAEVGGELVAVYCAGSDDDEDIGQRFIDTVNGSFRIRNAPLG